MNLTELEKKIQKIKQEIYKSKPNSRRELDLQIELRKLYEIK